MRSLQYSKIMLSNPNLYYTIASEMWKNNSELGNIRESLFVSQINLSINASKVVDYTISLESRKIEVEVGGKNKTRKQIQEIDN